MTALVLLETAVDLDERADGDPRRVSVSATLSAVLDNGRQITLLDDRGWGSTRLLETTTVGEIEDTARTVVGPDEPAEGQTHEEVAAAYWTHLAAVLGEHGVAAGSDALRMLPHAVVLSDRLRSRVRTA
ncbi:hypothetical protein SAMN05216276_103461 [Streptosporangium subroseum]|uniref:Uncharacterized protein n=1 Tax=Streptosporangium subroseum TaxID=106412 RepID=A0A239LQ64_9ACTN|nr:hypothetical protein [Streptosporangium subroseum]SNT32420.1 hypothetical protein SAMN05216276_103461 [Streptosporangium subroseum]